MRLDFGIFLLANQIAYALVAKYRPCHRKTYKSIFIWKFYLNPSASDSFYDSHYSASDSFFTIAVFLHSFCLCLALSSIYLFFFIVHSLFVLSLFRKNDISF